MKKLLLLFFFLSVVCAATQAQSKYISQSPMGQEDRKTDLEGDGGVLLLSKQSDLVISVVNAPGAKQERRGVGKSGMYEYVVIVDLKETRQPKLEVSRRGDVNHVTFTVDLRPNILRAYLIDEAEKPIALEEQTAGNDAILDATLAEVEIASAVNGLIVNCNPALGASITQKKKKSDETITIFSIKIPIANITNVQDNIASMRKSLEELSSKKNKSDAEYDNIDKLEEDIQTAEQKLADMYDIDVYAKETNHLSISLEGIGPRSKRCYGILALKTVVREHVSKCSGMLEEGGRLFSARKYDEAKRAFAQALKAEDTPQDIIPVINSNIAQCDSCILYENLTKGALLRITELKKRDAVTQADVSQYYTAAIEFMKITEKYNPCEYYTNIINSLETFVENMPLAMKFTIVRWISDRVSVQEEGPYPGIELWAYYGKVTPGLNDYSSERKFRKLVSSSAIRYKLLGTSDNNGIVDLEMPRKELPSGFFFRPKASDSNTDIVYKDMQEIMAKSKGEYHKRQFRMRMYVKK